MKKIYLFPGKIAISKEPAEITTILGSCVAVAIHDRKLKFSGLNHYLLPEVISGEVPSERYGEIAIRRLVDEMVNLGSDRQNLEAKVYGGGNVLVDVQVGLGIGRRNVEIALSILDELRIPIRDKNVLGERSRRILLNTESFEVQHSFNEDSSDSQVDTTGFLKIDTNKKVRVLIVDDSATVRSLFQKIFEKHGLEVIGAAADAYAAREIIASQKPDVMTLDIEMPRLSGVTFLEKLMKHVPMPVVMVSSLGSQGEAALRALELGAVEFVQKPSQFDPRVLGELGEMLVEKVRAASAVNVLRNLQKRNSVIGQGRNIENDLSRVTLPSQKKRGPLKLIVVGGNTGAQKSLATLLESLPADTPPVVISVSTISGFLPEFIQKLKSKTQVELEVAKIETPLFMGHVYLCPLGFHGKIESRGQHLMLRLEKGSPVCSQLPSSNVLFESAANVVSNGLCGVLLSGFGTDGVDGLKSVAGHGGFTLIENPETAQFPFAPQKALALGVVDQIFDSHEFSKVILDYRNRSVA